MGRPITNQARAEKSFEQGIYRLPEQIDAARARIARYRNRLSRPRGCANAVRDDRPHRITAQIARAEQRLQQLENYARRLGLKDLLIPPSHAATAQLGRPPVVPITEISEQYFKERREVSSGETR